MQTQLETRTGRDEGRMERGEKGTEGGERRRDCAL